MYENLFCISHVLFLFRIYFLMGRFAITTFCLLLFLCRLNSAVSLQENDKDPQIHVNKRFWNSLFAEKRPSQENKIMNSLFNKFKNMIFKNTRDLNNEQLKQMRLLMEKFANTRVEVESSPNYWLLRHG